MEDIVAVRLTLENGDVRYLLSWGRVPEPVDPKPLEALALAASTKFSLGGRAVTAEICQSLQEAAGEPYFFECFFSMCREDIPFGSGHAAWVEATLEAMRNGKEFYFLGRR